MVNVPASTQWTLDAAGPVGRKAVPAVFLIFCPKTEMKGTGFLLESGHILTNEHVVRGCGPADVLALNSAGQRLTFATLVLDADRDLALLKPHAALNGGLKIDEGAALEVGEAVATWGYPLGYNGPSPLLSVGYLAGFTEHKLGAASYKHLIVNGAFNPGNSGGPLFVSGTDRVIGVVVSKHAPITPYLLSAIKVLSENKSGVVYTATKSDGRVEQVVESQVVAAVLQYFRDLTQVMIGEAVASEVVKDFLMSNHAWPSSPTPDALGNAT